MPNAPYDVPAAVASTAEATKEVAEQAGGLGRYFAEVLGATPYNIVGLFGDRIAHRRARQMIDLYAGTKKRLEAAGFRIEDLRFPTGTIEVPLLAAASKEDRDELTNLWERLLAAAIAPGSRDRIRARHITIAEALEPLDAWLLQNFEDLKAKAAKARTQREAEGRSRNVGEISNDEMIAVAEVEASPDEWYVAFDALVRLNMLRANALSGYSITPEAKLFLSVVNAVRPR